MLYAVFQKELRHHLSCFRFLAGTVLVVVLSTLATLAGAADHQRRLERYEERIHEHRRELEESHVYSQLQPLVVKPPEPLSILDRGFEGRLGDEVIISIYSIPARASGELAENPFMASFLGFDFTTIVRVVLGLLALLLTFDAFIGEREKRTLELVLAENVSRLTLLAGKIAGAFTALLAVLATSGAISFWIIFLRGETELHFQQGLRLVALFFAYGGYLSLMLLIGFLISLLVRSAAQSLAYAILTWLFLIFIIPTLSLATARELWGRSLGAEAGEDAANRLAEERDQERASRNAQDPLRTGRNAHRAPFFETDGAWAVLYRYGSSKFYDSLKSYYIYETHLGMRYAEKIFSLRQGFENETRTAERRSIFLTSISPAFLLERLAESLAATSTSDHDDFLASCRSYRRSLITYLEKKKAFQSWRWFTDDPRETRAWTTLLGVEPEDVDDIEELVGQFRSPEMEQFLQEEREAFRTDRNRLLELSDLPTYRWKDPELGHALRRVAFEIYFLVGIQGVLFSVVLILFQRYEIRSTS